MMAISQTPPRGRNELENRRGRYISGSLICIICAIVISLLGAMQLLSIVYHYHTEFASHQVTTHHYLRFNLLKSDSISTSTLPIAHDNTNVVNNNAHDIHISSGEDVVVYKYFERSINLINKQQWKPSSSSASGSPTTIDNSSSSKHARLKRPPQYARTSANSLSPKASSHHYSTTSTTKATKPNPNREYKKVRTMEKQLRRTRHVNNSPRARRSHPHHHYDHSDRRVMPK